VARESNVNERVKMCAMRSVPPAVADGLSRFIDRGSVSMLTTRACVAASPPDVRKVS